MKKAITCFALISAIVATTAFAQPARLVVSVEENTTETRSLTPYAVKQPETCLTLRSGAPWCIPVLSSQVAASRASAQRPMTEVIKYRSATIRVPTELSLEEAESLLKSSGLYAHVERDVAVHASDNDWSTITPNDPMFSAQPYFDDNSDKNQIGSSVLSMWRKLKAPENNVDVYVMDGGFRLNKDIAYAPGVNFTVVEYDNERKPGFLESEFNEECDSAHGVGVAGVIGATINNDTGVAGVAGDVTLHPIRVLDCRLGFLTDVAAAMDWLSGGSDWLRQQSPDLPAFTGSPGVINLSLGGTIDECPVYLQNGINKVRAKGFVVVAAAGNESVDMAQVSPANCKGVISVGAADFYRETTPVDLAGFSNYGKTLNIMAQGVDVPGLLKDDAFGLWSGTSFSSPLVAGIIAAVKKDFAFTPAQWDTLVSISGDNFFAEHSQCATLGCGAGILNAAELYANAERMQEGELNQASYTLNAVSSCRQEWAVANLLPGHALCDKVTVTMDLYGNIAGTEVIKLFTVATGTSVSGQDTSNMTWVGEYRQSRFMVDKADVLSRDVYGQKCDVDTAVCEELSRVSTNELADVPTVCQ